VLDFIFGTVIKRLLYMAMLIILFFPTSFAVSQIAGDRVTGEQVKQNILDWLEAFKSLQCKYHYRFDLPSGEWKEEEIEYRWQNDMHYYQSVVLGHNIAGAEPIGSVLKESLVDGKSKLLGYQSNRATGHVNATSLSFAQSSQFLRQLFLIVPFEQAIRSDPTSLGLHTILSLPGIALLFEKGDQRIFMYWVTVKEVQSGVNVYLDNSNLITKIEYVLRPAHCLPDEAQHFATKDIYQVVTYLRTIELMNYEMINNLWFPCHVKETWYRPTEESVKRSHAILLRAARNEFTRCEASVKTHEDREYEPIPSTTEIHFDLGTIRINEKLKKSDFEVEIPPDTGLVDMETQEVFRTAQETWLERHADLLIILLALGILGGVTVAGWRYWLGKP